MLRSNEINELNNTTEQNNITENNNTELNNIIRPFQGLSYEKKPTFYQKLKKLPKITTINEVVINKLNNNKKN
jgi:hypothetical protein